MEDDEFSGACGGIVAASKPSPGDSARKQPRAAHKDLIINLI